MQNTAREDLLRWQIDELKDALAGCMRTREYQRIKSDIRRVERQLHGERRRVRDVERRGRRHAV